MSSRLLCHASIYYRLFFIHFNAKTNHIEQSQYWKLNREHILTVAHFNHKGSLKVESNKPAKSFSSKTFSSGLFTENL